MASIITSLTDQNGIIGKGETESLVAVSTCVLTLVALLGNYARRSSHQVLRLIVEAADVLSLPLFSTIIALVKDGGTALVILWAVFLLIIFADLDVFSDSPFEKDEQGWSPLIKRLVQGAWLAYFIQTSFKSRVSLPLFLLLFFGVAKMAVRFVAFKLASRSFALGKNTKLVSDYMMQQLQEEHDVATMSGYTYLVMGEEKQEIIPTITGYQLCTTCPGELLTLDKLWSLLDNDQMAEHRDLCLSFALFKLLRRRFSGYPLVEGGTPKALDFVLHGLLGPQSSVYHNNNNNNTFAASGRGGRAFRVIQVELALLNDYFYSHLPFNFYTWFSVTNVLLFLLLLAGCGWLVPNFPGAYYNSYDNYVGLSVDKKHFPIDQAITFVVMGAVVINEVWSFITYLASDWFKVMHLCIYARKSWWWWRTAIGRKVLLLLCRMNLFNPWDRKIGQYSILENSSPSNTFIKRLAKVMPPYFKEGHRIGMSIQVEEALLSSLRSSGGTLCRGTSSLRHNGVNLHFINEYCVQHRSDVEVILTWHIATVFCEIIYSRDDRKSEERDVASSLARYATYLVACRPNLLPVDIDHARHVLKETVDEAGKVAKECKDPKLVLNRVWEINHASTLIDNHVPTVVQKGGRLAEQLIEEGNTRGGEDWVWKVLAEFWAELLLYLAPSATSDVNVPLDHARCLKKGGELITHLWALLSHAGIVREDLSAEV